MGQKGGEHITSVHINLDNSLFSLKILFSREKTNQAKKSHKGMQNMARTDS